MRQRITRPARVTTTSRLINPRGFTLIETVMVIVLLGILAAGVLTYFLNIAGVGEQVFVVQAIELAQVKTERIMAEKRAVGFVSVTTEAAAALPPPFDNFTREVAVVCVSEADLDTSAGTMPGCADSDINAKRVEVTVSWTRGTGGSVDIVTVISDH